MVEEGHLVVLVFYIRFIYGSTYRSTVYFQKCMPKEPGTQCRSADHECDLPEYCTGESEYCPTDVFKMDGESCDKGTAFCYQVLF